MSRLPRKSRSEMAVLTIFTTPKIFLKNKCINNIYANANKKRNLKQWTKPATVLPFSSTFIYMFKHSTIQQWLYCTCTTQYWCEFQTLISQTLGYLKFFLGHLSHSGEHGSLYQNCKFHKPWGRGSCVRAWPYWSYSENALCVWKSFSRILAIMQTNWV